MSWDRSLRDCALEAVMAAMAGQRMEHSLTHQWNGWVATVGSGDVQIRAVFANLDAVPEWFVVNAEAIWPEKTVDQR